MLVAVDVDGLFFPQRIKLGLDARESTPGFKRQVVLVNAEARSLKRAKILLERVLDLSISTNTIERISLEVGSELESAKDNDWSNVLNGESVVPSLAIVSFDGGRIRTRKTGCGPGVHLSGKGWNETKNAIFVSASSTLSVADPEPLPPKCFIDQDHVAKLTQTAKSKEITEESRNEPERHIDKAATTVSLKIKQNHPSHKPQRIMRTIISSMKNSTEFGKQMAREAKRRRFSEATRKAFVGDGLICNWTIQATHFSDYTAILDFVHAVTYLHEASQICFGKTEEAWKEYVAWMISTWQGKVNEVIAILKSHQETIGHPTAETASDAPAERLRCIIQYLSNNNQRMHYQEYRCQGLPTTSAWMESAVKEINYRTKGTDMFWNNPEGAEAILQIRAASLSDDDRLVRFLAQRRGSPTLRKPPAPLQLAA